MKLVIKIWTMAVLSTAISYQVKAQEQSVSQILADITITTKAEDITPRAYKKAKMSIIDIVGVAAAGFDAPGIPEIREQYLDWAGKQEANVWFTNKKIPTPLAAFVNSSTAHAMDFDDTHRASNSHISVVVTPAALVMAENLGSTGQELLEAIVVGVEVVASIGKPFTKSRSHGKFLPTSVIGGFGATAAACRLLKLNVEQTINAFGIFYAHSSGNRQALFDKTLTKRIQPAIASQAGITAAVLASKGITGPENIFLSEAGLLRLYGHANKPYPTPDAFARNSEKWKIEDLCFKRYASCGAAHPIVEAALKVTLDNDLTINEVDSIELFNIFVGSGMVDVPWRDAENPQAMAQFCAPYNVASVIKNRQFGPAQIEPEVITSDKEVDQLARKVTIKRKEAWGEGYPGGHTVRITTIKGEVLTASFEPVDLFHPEAFSMEDIINKFEDNMKYTGIDRKKGVHEFIQKALTLETLNDSRKLTGTIPLIK